MKTIYLLLLFSLTAFANTLANEKPIPTKTNISGLKIVAYNSEKKGKHIYVVSNVYTKKKITFYNSEGNKIYTTKTVGSPIYLSKFEKGTYMLKIKEGKKRVFKEITID